MKTWQLIVVGVAIHLVFFYSIFDIYFTSPIVHGMTPHSSPLPPPARRLVFFSADGLRADKLFEVDTDGKTNAPYLRSIVESRGAWGVSHTRVPTESRPGHVALIAGFYEDVSAVAKGWKENPVEFDSVFNESQYTWSWGSPDILPMFAKGASGDHVFTSCYPSHYEDFANSDSTLLDSWVFYEVKKFFKQANKDKLLREKLHQDKIVFFLHLLGIDTNGHVNKPYSSQYMENIRYIDKGMKEMEELINGFYGNDGKTAYVMSSDHGMTDWGSHGAGHPSETLTPIIAWGAGVRGPQHDHQRSYKDGFSEEWKLSHLERDDIEQADVAPLMAALIGVKFPMNSVGILPKDYLNMSDWETAELMYANLQQILAQYQVKMELKRSTTLSLTFRHFSELTPAKMADIHRHIRSLIQAGHYQEVIEECSRVMELALRGLSYYQSYDRFFLGTSIFFGFAGWMTYILTLVLEDHSGVVKSKVKVDRLDEPYWKSERVVISMFVAVGVLITLLLFIQSLPWTNYLYCLLPVILWMLVVMRSDVLKQAVQYTLTMKKFLPLVITALSLSVGLEILVLGFFQREMMSVGLVLIGMWPLIEKPPGLTQVRRLRWLFACLSLAVFPMLPVAMGFVDRRFVVFGGVAAVIGSTVYIIRNAEIDVQHVTSKTLYIIQIFLICIATYLSGYSVDHEISTKEQFISWSILGVSAVLPLFGPTGIISRLLTVVLAFISPFILLSISHEIFFIICLCWLLYEWINLEYELCNTSASVSNGAHKSPRKSIYQLDFSGEDLIASQNSRKYLEMNDIRRAFFFAYLILTGFFGTGNIASINSFNPASVLCFLSVFNPFVMGALMLWKILIPCILITCTLRAVHVITRVPIRALFLLIFLMSDVMALHFFFLVRDYGSWLDIGTSISHYVIVMCMIIFIMLLFGVCHILTNGQIRIGKTLKRN